MTKRFSKKTAYGLLLSLLLSGGAAELQAKMLLSEPFDYKPGGLYGQGEWVRHSKNTNEPIQLVAPALSYPGYQDAAAGLSAKLIGTAETTAHERLQKQFDAEGVKSGIIYVAALMNVQKADVGNVYFFTLAQRGAKADAGVIDQKTGSEIARLFASGTDCAEGKFKFGLSKNGASPQNYSTELDLGKTHLVVMKYEFVDGTNNDILTLYVNPRAGDEPAAADVAASTTTADATATMGLQAVTLRQGSTSNSKLGPDVLIDAVKVTDSWADLWTGNTGSGETPDPVPGDAAITAPASIDFGSVLQYATASTVINVKATGLTDNITVSSTASGVTPAVTSIPMDEAMSTQGYDLTLNYSAASSTLEGNLVLSTPGAESVEIPCAAQVVPVTPFANFRQVENLKDFEYYYFQGKATVTFIDLPNNRFYAQDIYGGGAMFDLSMCNSPLTLNMGDRFTNAYCMPGEAEQGVSPLYLMDYVQPTVTASDVVVEPLELTLSELSRNPDDYINRLVMVNGVDFADAAGQKFSTVGVAATTAEGSGRVRAFAGTDVIGTEIPAKAVSVTGISTSAAAAVVTMRSLADIVPQQTEVEQPALEVERELLIDANEYQKIGETVQFAKFTVTYSNLPSAAAIWLGGAARGMYSLSTEEIPAGSGTAEIILSYHPTTVGRHAATINFDAMPTELSQTIAFAARAYNPEVMPQISVNTEDLTEFVTEVNVPVKQSITYSAANLLDYGVVRVAGTGKGAFLLSAGSTLKDVTDATLTITFNPKAEGSFTETIIFESDLAEPVSFVVTGRTNGTPAPPQGTEGDEFTMDAFNTDNAHALLIEDFENCGESNKPLKLEGWTNAALTGTRAWWAYKELDADNSAAKVTAYDSKATDSSQASMLLLSPALDFVNAKQPLLTFRVKGKLLLDGMTDNLQVLYVDPTTEETQSLQATRATSPLDNVWVEAFQGLNIPASADYNDEWIDYVIDLKNQELADRFFIGFGFTAMRGNETTASYFVDDFSWGRDDIPFIRPSQQILDMEAYLGQDNVSGPIEVEGLNLNGPITLKVTGANASKFSVEPASLPAEGGSFTIRFNSDEVGVHAAYISLSSPDAPEALVSVEANNQVYSAIDGIASDVADAPADVYNLQGILLMRDVRPSEAVKTLPAGFYIIGGKKVHIK